MGCVASQPAQIAKQEEETSTVPPVPEATAEEKAIAELKLLFKSMDVDNDKTVDSSEFQKAMANNGKIGDLIKEADLNPEKVYEQLDTNKDGRVSWDEFEKHLKSAAFSLAPFAQQLKRAWKKRAEARLKEVFDSIDINKDGFVDRDELATKLIETRETVNKNDFFITLMREAGIDTQFVALDQIDTNKDGRISWKEFYDALSQAAEAEVKATEGVIAAPELAPPMIEDVAAAKYTCCVGQKAMAS